MFVKIAFFTLFLLITPFMLLAQDAAEPDTTKQKYETPPEIVQLIELAESKLYSPIDQGLKDLRVTHKLALNNAIRTLWFKAPDQVKGIMGRPERIELKSPGKVKPVVVEMKVPEIVARKGLYWLMGKPMSYFLPYGTFEVLEKNETGTHLRFTADKDDRENLRWSHADFYLDEEFRLTKIKEKLAAENNIEEHIIHLKPYKEGEKLLVFDKISTIVGYKKGQKIINSTYVYKEVDSFLMIDHIVRRVQAEGKDYMERYEAFEVNKGLDDSLFVKKED